MSASDTTTIGIFKAKRSTTASDKSASYRVFHTPELLENILLKTMELPTWSRTALGLAHLDKTLKLTIWDRKSVCSQMKTLLLSQRVCMAFRRIIQRSIHLQRELWLLPPATPLGFIRLNPLFSADKYAYSIRNQVPFTKITVCSTPHSQTSMHLNHHMWEERPGSWQKMRVTWSEEWESYINYSKRDSHSHDLQFTMQFPGCPTADDVVEKIKLQMKLACPQKGHADMFG
ncbi:uncharacterized protein RCC_09792 [Ramularia collo-cygni]|uniref:Uncharacterized protein n=1 Tax=Ramularia collo-cygni TaxID=112498 RepID=A0A2D3VE41_9PEZI|nr:uncharacterized protein RCC_09792 [Ramularia collo-cygni]CZT24075.1 uncharacterized protein RCC_09792 [Ramularia collo-cygni]